MLRYNVAIGTNSCLYDYTSTNILYPRGQANIGNVCVVTGRPYYQTKIPVTKTIFWKVCSIDSAFIPSQYSIEQTVLQPGVPGGLTAVSVSTDQIDLAWNDIPNETGFTLFRSITNNTNSAINAGGVSINITNYDDIGLASSTTYYYWIKAYNSMGSSGFSDPASNSTFTGSINTNTNTSAVIIHTPVETMNAGQGAVISATIIDPGGIKQARVYYRGTGDGTYSYVDMSAGNMPDLYRASIPVQERAGDLYYYIQVIDSKDGTNRSPVNIQPGYRSAVLPPDNNGVRILNNLIDISKGETESSIQISISGRNRKSGIEVKMKVYSINGRLVKSFESINLFPGVYSIPWQIEDRISSGLYLLHVKTDSPEYKDRIKRLIIIR
jgi:hypothetical protein